MSQTSRSTSRSTTRAMLVNFGGILCSRLTGLARDMLVAAFWGSTEIFQAAFTTAFAVANTFRGLFAEGAFSSAFVPALSKKLAEGQKDEAWDLACRSITLIGCVLGVIVVLGGLAGTLCASFFGHALTEEARCTSVILPVVLPYALFICLAGAFAAILNSLRHFVIPAFSPCLFNVVQVVTVALLFWLGKTRHEFSSLMWFCASVLFSGLLQLAIMLLACRRRGFRFHFDFNFRTPAMYQLGVKFFPAAAAAGVYQLNTLADKAIALALGATAVGAINYANRLVFLPIGLIGVAMGQACLPHMSRACEHERGEILESALRQVLYFSLPTMTIFVALKSDIVSLLFQRGAFNEQAVRECVWTLLFYLPGVPAFCLAKVATAFHHSRQDTKTPFRVTLLCVVLNFILNLILCQFLRQAGLALASALCSWLNVAILLVYAAKCCPGWHKRRSLATAVITTVSAVAAGFVAHVCANALRQLEVLTRLHPNLNQLIVIAVAGLAALCVHILIATFIGRQNVPSEILAAVRRKKR